MRAIVPAVSLLAAALALSACKPASFTAPSGEATAKPAAPAAAKPAAGTPDDNLNAVLWVQRSDEYRANAISIYRAAADHLDAALKEPHWDALVPAEREATAPLPGLKPAVIMDIDETVLDNSPYQARLVASGQEYNEVSWAEWVAEKKARPVPGVLEFARAAEAKGVTILYLSNRAQHLQEATRQPRRRPAGGTTAFLGLGTHVEGWSSTAAKPAAAASPAASTAC